MLCYLKLHVELSVRAKALLMMKETGHDVKIEQSIKDKFSEIKYLEKAIGQSGMIALKPLLHYSDRDLWQIYFLENSQ